MKINPFIFKIIKQLLWDATLKNIMSGQDEMSPLVQPLPKTYSQDDPELIEIIRKKYLIQPSEQGTWA